MRPVLLACVWLASVQLVFSQTVDNYNYTIESPFTPVNGFFFLGLATGFPDAQFKQAMDSDYGGPSLGFSSGFGLNPYGKKRESPILLGLDFSYHTFGRDKITDPVTSLRYKASYNSYFVGPLMRFYPHKEGKIAPFVEGSAGLSVLNARIKNDRTIFEDSEEEIIIDSKNDTGFGYSLAVGFHGNRKKEVEVEGQASFFLRLLYSWGDRSQYIKRGSVTMIDDVLNYETGYTTTNMFQVQLGLILH